MFVYMVYLLGLNELMDKLLSQKKKLIMPLSSISDTERLENYLDYERSRNMLGTNEIMFVVEQNSNFLSVIENDKDCPYNILGCISYYA